MEELDKWADTDFYEKEVRKMQLPFTPAPSTSGSGLSQEQQQRRKENVRRLVEMNARKREERVQQLCLCFCSLFFNDYVWF